MAVTETAEVVRVLGETMGFWIQTGAFVFSAFGAIAIIYNNSHQAKKRATIDLALHEYDNEQIREAKKQLRKFQDDAVNITELACGNHHSKPENDYIQTLLNHYEFIAAGIKEGAFDEEIYKRMKRSIIIHHWHALSAYIAERRRVLERDQLYMEFEWLAKRWENSIIITRGESDPSPIYQNWALNKFS